MSRASDFHGRHDGRRYKPLESSMDNVIASMLGRIATAAGDPSRTDVGDSIDRGLILRRLLEEAGLEIWIAGDAKPASR